MAASPLRHRALFFLGSKGEERAARLQGRGRGTAGLQGRGWAGLQGRGRESFQGKGRQGEGRAAGREGPTLFLQLSGPPWATRSGTSVPWKSSLPQGARLSTMPSLAGPDLEGGSPGWGGRHGGLPRRTGTRPDLGQRSGSDRALCSRL